MNFETCLSGLNNSSKALDVIGNNIANSGTVGFKVAKAQFSDVFAATLSNSHASQVGLGSGTMAIVQSFKQGGITRTDNPLDVAINGDGFFRMNDGETISYTRNGQFRLVAETTAGAALTPAQQAAQPAILTNTDGLRVTGYLADYATDPRGTITKGTPADIIIQPAMEASATTRVSTIVNLDSREAPKLDGLGNPIAFDPNDPDTYTSATSATVYDENGNPRALTMYFAARANTWDLYTTLGHGQATGSVDLSTLTYPIDIPAPGATFTIDVDGGAPQTASLRAGQYAGPSAIVSSLQSAIDGALGSLGSATVSLDANNYLVIASDATGAASSVNVSGLPASLGAFTASPGEQTGPEVLTFDAYGQLTSPLTVPLAYTGGEIQLDFFKTITVNGVSQTVNTSQYGSVFGVNSLTVDGYPDGNITGMHVNPDGIIEGRFSNGQSRILAQLVLAKFNNPNGLISMGNNQWIESSLSGVAQLDTPGNPNPNDGAIGVGVIQGGALEESNIDLSGELVAMIEQQRFYQANAQSVKTQDQMLQTLSGIR